MADDSEPTLTLSLGGVSFTLNPNKDDNGSVTFEKGNNEVLLNLSSFSGTLRVALSTTSESTSTPSKTEKQKEAPEIQEKEPASLDVTPKTRHVSKKVKGNKRAHEEEAENGDELTKAQKKSKQTAIDEEQVLDETCSQPTLLGQPDFTQTQLSATDLETSELGKENNNTTQQSMTQDDEAPSKVQEIMKDTSCSPEPKDTEDVDQASVKSHPSFIMEDEEQTETTKAAPARVSLGSPVRPKSQAPPCPRWGHTMTGIENDRILIYGGQTFDAETGFPKTLNDLYIYDTSKQVWIKPFNCDGMPRQWHSATYVPERQLLISFGGEAVNPKTGKAKTTDQVMVLDTEIMLWYPPTVSGDVPSGRSGHTATMLPETNELVVFGGVKGSKWLNSVSVLDTTRWKWTAVKTEGSAPKPRSYHSATAVSGNRIVVFGGNDAATSFNTVHILETQGERWRWTHPKAIGYGPSPRTGHCATLLADKKTICIYGGWDPNDEANANDESMIFQDCYLLDTEKWTWKKGPKPAYAAVSAEAQGENGGAKRVGHSAVLNGTNEVLVFGGRIPRDRFVGDFQSLRVSNVTEKSK